MTGGVYSIFSATRRMVTASYPSAANSSRAASRMRARSCWRSRARRATEGDRVAITWAQYLTPLTIPQEGVPRHLPRMTVPTPPPDFRGVLRTDDAARAVYAEAAGIARVVPRAVAVPADADDVVMLVRWAHETGTPLVPRGSGSSMPGGAIGRGVILDLSRLRRIAAVDEVSRSIAVEPGVLRAEVDRAARAKGLRFPVDP